MSIVFKIFMELGIKVKYIIIKYGNLGKSNLRICKISVYMCIGHSAVVLIKRSAFP